MAITKKSKIGGMQTFGKSKNPKRDYYDVGGKAPKGTGQGPGRGPQVKGGSTIRDMGTYKDTKQGRFNPKQGVGASRQGPCTLAEMKGKNPRTY